MISLVDATEKSCYSFRVSRTKQNIEFTPCFKKGAESVVTGEKHEIRDEWSRLHGLHPEAATEIIGWSLGSGQAILCAQDLNYNFGVKPYIYTFGTVRPFKYTRSNKKQMRKYLKSIYTACYNITNNEDIVTYMPPFYGFTMPRQVKIGHRKRKIKNLMNPLVFHTIYDEDRLYRRKKND